MLASTLFPQPDSMVNAPFEEDVNMSFGRLYFLSVPYGFSSFKMLINCFESSFSCSMLLHGLILSESDGDLEVCCAFHVIFNIGQFLCYVQMRWIWLLPNYNPHFPQYLFVFLFSREYLTFSSDVLLRFKRGINLNNEKI